MAFYIYSRSNVTPVVGNDLLTLISAANRRFCIHEVYLAGLGIQSQANDFSGARSTGGTTPSASLTPEKESTDTAAPAMTNATAWAVQPALAAGTPLKFAPNSNGGQIRWVAKTRTEMEFRNLEQFSLRPTLVGGANISFHVIVEEL